MNYFFLITTIILLSSCKTNVEVENTTSQKETNMKLIYIMDPQCGWCYGNEKSIASIYENFNHTIPLEIITGGMWLGNNAPRGGAQFENFIKTHSPRMEQVTGANVSPKFYELTKDTSYVFGSYEACLAINAVKKIAPSQTYYFSKKVQEAQFVDGKKYDDINTYTSILSQLSIPKKEFIEYWTSEENKNQTQKDFQFAGQYANGFPSLLIENNGEIQALQNGFFQAMPMIQKIHELLQDSYPIVEGKIIRKQFKNKGGKEPEGVYDYYFEMKEETKFIKTVSGTGGMAKKELESYLDKKIKAKVIFNSGSLDSDPTLDYPVQSRGGDYVIIYKIINE